MNRFYQALTHIRDFSPVFWVTIAATLLNQAGNMAFVFLIIYLTDYLHFTLTQASFAFMAFSCSVLLTGLIGGSLIDKFGAVRSMVTSLFVNGTILFFFPLLHNYAAVLFMCLLWGFSYSLYRPASQTLVTQLSTPGMHKITFSVFRLAVNLGMSIGPALGGYLAEHSFIGIFIVNSFANLLAACVLMIGLMYRNKFESDKTPERKLELNLHWLVKDRALRLFILAMIPLCMVFFQHESTLVVFLSSNLHLPLSFYGWLFTLNTLLIVFFELPLNMFSLHWTYRTNFILGSLFITLGFFGLAAATQAWQVILLVISWTLGEMLLFPSATSYIADIAPETDRGSYMSVFYTCSNIGMFLGPWAGAIIFQHLGPTNLWLLCGLWGMISVLLFSFQRQPKASIVE